ncbi:MULTISPECIES: amidohydrolase family protein [Microbacterium]|uniref:amidohydrolase family protein n=1 Tax=Microbacterium TaxID=33882 RepID=UPI00217E11D9|nr:MULTISPECIES: amidohydrolase family protein [Microbacterium]UWF77349.1 amidohydrolase family protein [Microbacterium neungamense]WCM55510.1 amidohydrolase family protein [Microbacterium sp. EF45047]
MRVLDSHLHLWDPGRLDYDWLDGALDGRFAADELAAARLGDAGAEAAVFVQAECVEGQHLDEARWVAEIADEVGVRAIVAGARLDRGRETSEHLAALDGVGLVAGIRHLLQDEPPGLATTPVFLDGAREVAARGWTFDACVRAPGIGDVAALATAVPELPIVLDHLGKPAVGTARAPLEPAASWRRDLGELARHPQVCGKLSGLPAEAGGDWDAAQLAPFLDAALEAFGPERLMWGSDWPVSAVGPAGYDRTSRAAWFEAVATWARARELDLDALFWGNAARFYGIR